MLSSYEVVGSKVEIKTAYSEVVVKKCREWAGKFDRAKSCWVVPSTRLPEIQERLGKDQEDQVEVEVGNDQIEGYAQIRVGWYILASRRGRDYGADVYADLVAGTIPPSGGSMKNPAVDQSEDSRFRLWVPRDFAVARNLQIVTDLKAGQPEPTEEANPLAVFTDEQLLAELKRRNLPLRDWTVEEILAREG